MDNNQSSKLWINHIFNIAFDVLKKWQFILFVSITIALAFDAIVTVTHVPTYSCNATFAIRNSNSSSNGDDDLGETFTYIFQSNVFKKTIQKAMNVESLNGYYSASVQSGTNVLYVSATSPSVATAYKMMNALMDHYGDISRMVVGDANIDVISDLKISSSPINEISHVKNIVLIGGGVAFVIIAFFSSLSFMRNTIKDKNEIESKLHLHLLGNLPKESKITSFKGLKRKKNILISQYSTSFQYVESFKRLRNRVEKYCKKHECKTIMVTSSLENEGKSSVAVNLALSLALNKHKVLLIDADLRKPSLHLILEEKDEHHGIEHVLFDERSYKESIIHLKQHHLDVLFGYCLKENTSELIQSQQMQDLLDHVREEYDYVIIDSSPSRFLSDSRMLATMVDSIMLVVRQNHAELSTILNTIDKLSLSKTPIMGCVNNQSYSLGINSGHYHGYHYGYNRYYNRRRRED